MTFTSDKGDGTRSINRIETFVGALAGRSILGIADFTALLEVAEQLVEAEYPQVSRNALNNARGDWYETLITLGALEYAIESESAYVMVNLPNISTYSCENLYVDEVSGLIADLRRVLTETADVSLISSNPDFVIVSADLLDLEDTSDGLAQDVDYAMKLYENLNGECGFKDIIGYVSVKSGLRPDRRLQIAHEGSLMKALYRHVQTRLWAIDAPGIRYYGLAGAATEADREALKTVATHSIVDVSGRPESAVDQLFVVNSGKQLREALDKIIPDE